MFDATAVNDNILYENFSLPFLIENASIRGRFARLNSAVNSILSGHKYPEKLSHILGELLVLSSLIGTSSLKTEGIVTLQINAKGLLSFIVADCTNSGKLRGYAKIRDDLNDEEQKLLNSKDVTFDDLIGEGLLIMTIEDGKNKDRHQGMVSLKGTNISDAVMHYFDQSVQRPTHIKIDIDKITGGRKRKRWCAGGILLQRIPLHGGKSANLVPSKEQLDEQEDHWNTSKILLDSVTKDELVDPNEAPAQVLYKLFHENGVRVFGPIKLQAKCRCSRKKILDILGSMKIDDINSLKNESGKISVVCQFCNKERLFDESDIA